MSCSIVQNPQILQNPPAIQKPQNSHYSKYAVGFAAGAVATGTLIGSALAINSYLIETPSLFSNLVNAENLKSVLKAIGVPAIGGLGGALISGGTAFYMTRQVCSGPFGNLGAMGAAACFTYGITLVSAAAGGFTGAAALTVARILPV